MKIILTLILATQVLFAEDFNMNSHMKAMKESLKCLTKNSGVLNSCKTDLEEVAKIRQNINLCSQNSNAYYVKLHSQGLISQVPNPGDIKKAFDNILDQLSRLELAVKEKNVSAQETALSVITSAIKESHRLYKPELE